MLSVNIHYTDRHASSPDQKDPDIYWRFPEFLLEILIPFSS